MDEQKIIAIPVNPIDEPIREPIPIETDFPIGGPSPEATIRVEGDTTQRVAELSTDILLPIGNPIVGTNGPDILLGTRKDDLILALGGDDTIIGSLGNDTINGGAGFDSLDYRELGRKITLLPQGLIGNGNTQGSQIQGIERIIGPRKKNNTIDGSNGKGPVSFDIDLSKDLLVVEDIPRLGSVKFVVENFVNVEGTQNSDSIIGDKGKNKLSGNGGNDKLIGKFGNDTLIGGSGNDTLTGADPSLADTVRREKDVLTGGSGTDKFILGNKSGSFYDDFGNKDFAKITDFSFGEQINLGSGETYDVKQTKQGFNIFVLEDFGRDLIAKVTISSGIIKGISSAKSLSTDNALREFTSDALLSFGDFDSITLDNQGILKLA
ncbi:MAG: calcium-binding protein [Rivularia sp. (in: cyanobacteria)]